MMPSSVPSMTPSSVPSMMPSMLPTMMSLACPSGERFTGTFTTVPDGIQMLAGLRSAERGYSLDNGFVELDPETGTVVGQIAGLRRDDDQPTYAQLRLSISCDGATGEANLVNLPVVNLSGQPFPYDPDDPFTATFNQQDDRLISCTNPICWRK